MVATLIGAFLPFILKALGMFIDKKVSDVNAKQKYWDFVDSMNKSGYANIPARLKDSFDEQTIELEAMAKLEREKQNEK